MQRLEIEKIEVGGCQGRGQGCLSYTMEILYTVLLRICQLTLHVLYVAVLVIDSKVC